MDILTQFYIEAYKKKLYSDIAIGCDGHGNNFYLTRKQMNALDHLTDMNISSVGYGGGARSGKTMLECFWVVFQCLSYDGVAYGLCRKELSVLKQTVLLTLFEMLSFYNLKDGVDYKYQEQRKRLVFTNGSMIHLIDMAYQPSDPLYTRFGGLELTAAAVDESNENDMKSLTILGTRCNWKKNDVYGLPSPILETFNPDKGHVYKRFYAPYRDSIEPSFKKFIPALPTDNPHPAIKKWVEQVSRSGDRVTIERLINGNFDYDDNPDALVQYDAICDLFANDNVQAKGLKYISTDLALQGRDKFIGMYWHGLVGEIKIDKKKATGKSVEYDLRKLIQNKGVYNSNVVSDADGLGNYLSSYIKNIKSFRGNGRAVNNKDYGNIKDECGYKLAELINARKMKIICTSEQEERIKQELAICLRRDNMDSDTQKKKLIKKAQAKQELGFSPDYYDTIMMRCLFELKRFSGRKFQVKAS